MVAASFFVTLQRTLGAWALGLYGLGAIVGAGIYSVIGAAAGIAGNGLWMSFLVSGALALVTALSYAELSTLLPKAGGELIYLRRALPTARSLAFSVGAMVVLSSAATVATVSIAFGGYLGELVEVPIPVSALIIVVALTALAVSGVQQSTMVAAIFTAIEIAGLLAVVWIGTRSPRFGEALAMLPSPEVFAGASLVFFAFLGFENVVNLAAEAKDPGRTMPRAILGSLAAAVVIYVLVALAVTALASPEALAHTEAPLTFAVVGRSPMLAAALGPVALFATANTALASIVSGSRVVFAMAEEGDVPKAFGKVLARRKTPWIATLIVSAVALALLPLGDIGVVASVSSFAALMSFASVNVAVVVLRRREPDRARPFRTPWSIGGVPVLASIGCFGSVALITRLESLAVVVGGASWVALALARIAWSRP